jgi:hypothetical protein
MSENNGGGNGGAIVPPRRRVKHYHGDNTRILFVICAVVLIVAKSTGADIPLSTAGTVIAAILLVVAAGITNPAQGWIHWLNALIAVYGTLLFGITAVDLYGSGKRLSDPSFFYIEALALLSLIALYLTTKTIRGYQLRPNLS